MPAAVPPDAGTPDQDGSDREIHNLRSAYERVRSEALVYRDQRDELQARTERLGTQVSDLTAQLRATKNEHAAALQQVRASLRKAQRRLRRTRRRLRALEQSRAVRLTRSVRRWQRRLAAAVQRRPATPPALVQPAVVEHSISPADRAVEEPVPVVVPFGTQMGLDSEASNAAAAAAASSAARLAERLAHEDRPLRLATIVDDFTRQSLSVECHLEDLHPDTWSEEITRADPDLLFVESAWRGEGGSWHNTVPKLTDELRAILAHCRDAGIPTVFWSKEDPVHFQTFLRTAREFDHVFTTDVDCVPRYRAALGHDRVGFLPFACQPRLQNPVEQYVRKDALGFAGGYYTRYPERMRDLDALITGAAEVMPVEIWDRMYGTTLTEYAFPESYQPLIQGTLAANEIHVAYKGYRFALNLNSVKHSQSMFARRAYELLSSGTVTVSNFARGLRVMLGDLVPMTDSPEQAHEILRRLRDDPVAYDRLRLMGLRKVHTEHTYAERLRTLVSAITGRRTEPVEPRVAVLVPIADEAEVAGAIAAVATQRGVQVAATYVTADAAAAEALRLSGVDVVDDSRLDPAALVADADGLAVLDPRDWYGPTYLIDLVLALAYADAEVVGKAEPAHVVSGTVRAAATGIAYRPCQGLEPRSALVSAAAAQVVAAPALLAGGAGALADLRQFSIDRFDYCRDGAGQEAAALVDLLGDDGTDTGTPLAEVYRLVEVSRQEKVTDPGRPVVSYEALARVRAGHLDVRDTGQGVRFRSSLAPGKVDLRWLHARVPVAQLWPDGVARAHLDYDGDLHLMIALRFFDADGRILESITQPASKLVEHPLPAGAHEVAIALRLAGPGTSTIRTVSLAHPRVDPVVVPSDNDVLLVTDHYPSRTDLYRNGFIHTRVRGYRHRGVEVDVFRTRSGEALSYHEFGGVEVTSGSFDALERAIQQGAYRTILVHFLSEDLWEALAPFRQTHRIICWVHGAEVKPWWRRSPELMDDAALATAKEQSDRRVAFWQSLLDDLPPLTSFVLVSRYFADEMQADLERTIPEGQLHVIHNPVDTDLFAAAAKPTQMRHRVLSIRPFASPKYANDLAVAAVLELRDEPWFDQLTFCFVGDGPLFAETVEPLRDLPNVVLRQQFLTQPEMAELHREYGVFLTPTRSDTQGVSRDEAMASGLVPISSDVEAVPEFLSLDEGYLAPPEDHVELARAIADLHANPDLFSAKSVAAAARARRQVSSDVVLPDEIRLILGSD